MKCRLCHAESKPHFQARVLGEHDAEYRYCAPCDHVFAADPHWLAQAYSDAIVQADTDIAVRNILTALRLSAILYFAFPERGRGTYVDVAGGYGLLTRLMRDVGFDYRWSDPYAQNLFARGFEHNETTGPCDALSAVEVLEHTIDPLEFLRSNLARHQSDTILFTTQVFADGQPPGAREWDYYSLNTGQHIAFFSTRGLRTLGERLGLTYHGLGRIHLLTRRHLSTTRLALAAHRALALPLTVLAARQLGSRRGRDQTELARRFSPPARPAADCATPAPRTPSDPVPRA
jgi:hypothetical protein